MVQARVDLTEKSNRILNIVKAIHNLKDKSEAIDFVVSWYAENRFDPQDKKMLEEMTAAREK
jgi:hypothetical protein